MVGALETEGGVGVIQLLPDVRVAEHLVASRTMYHAARTARRLFQDSDNLEYVERAPDRDDIIRIGWWQPSEEYGVRSTIWGHPDQKRMGSLLECAKSLIDFMGIERPNYINLMTYEAFDELEPHQDFFAGARGLLNLAGMKLVQLQHPELQTVNLEICTLPGDAYEMKFTDDEKSILHAVELVAEPNITMYINTSKT